MEEGTTGHPTSPHAPGRTGHPGESRLPAAVAILVAIGLYAALPNKLVLGPRYLVPALELALLVPLLLANPGRMNREDQWLRRTSITLVLVIAATNTAALLLLLHELVTAPRSGHGNDLIIGAGQVWATNIVMYGLVFWELDRGGPVVRTQHLRETLPAADFRFPQDEDEDAVREVARRSAATSGWVATFYDYLYVSVTNSTAFSPTDTMPLSGRAKLLMSAQGISALVTMVLVIARGVNLLS
ncbi:MAG TPA: hypothetical protein VMI11_05285 [Actinomycetes bacterium]|nr:hypothetical protein [Actinomycetes bacterium]